MINAFHDYEDPRIAQSSGRLLASDFDLLFRMRTLADGSVRNDTDHEILAAASRAEEADCDASSSTYHECSSEWTAPFFQHVLAIAPNCEMAGQAAIRSADELGFYLTPIRRLEYESGEYCLIEYTVGTATSP